MEGPLSIATAQAVTRTDGLDHAEAMIITHELEKLGVFFEEVYESDLGWYVEVGGADHEDSDGPRLTITRHAGRIILSGPWLDRPWDCDAIHIAAMKVSDIVRYRLSI